MKLIKTEQAEQFECSRCKEKGKKNYIKKSKLKAILEDGKIVCNGCYGELLSKNKV